MNIEEFLTLAAKEEASDLFIVAGLPLTMKVNGVMRRINEEKMMPQDTEKIIREIYEKALDRECLVQDFSLFPIVCRDRLIIGGAVA